jgi:hypothetical protein
MAVNADFELVVNSSVDKPHQILFPLDKGCRKTFASPDGLAFVPLMRNVEAVGGPLLSASQPFWKTVRAYLSLVLGSSST